MKTKLRISAVLLVTLLLASCEQEEISSTKYGAKNDVKEVSIDKFAALTAFSTNTDSLTQSEKEGLLLMREEEKLAQDVYDSFYSTYGVLTFDKISNSEAQHTAAVLALINHFGLTDPALPEAGKFSSIAIQKLYDQLISAGTSSNAALSTGAYIEEYDIADLKKLMAETTNTDILAVYKNLLDGSDNHLRAYVNALKTNGIVYSPQILSSIDFAAIIAATNSNKKGKGNVAVTSSNKNSKGNVAPTSSSKKSKGNGGNSQK